MIEGTTRSGLRYAALRSGRNVAFCSLSIRCGTRDEGDMPLGIAHFLEHALFKGTARHRAAWISSCLDNLGGELNAYTTREEIVLHSTVLQEDLPKAVAMLLEIASDSVFPEKEVETEKSVVIDEILSFRDCPADAAYDSFEEKYFAASPLGRPILGTEESVRNLTPQQLRDFFKSRFVPWNMALTIVAPQPEEKLQELVEKLSSRFWTLQHEPSPLPCSLAGQSVPPVTLFDFREDRDDHEANVVIGGLAPSLYQGRSRHAAILLANILGGPAANSMLGSVLRERNGWVYAVECAYTQYRDCGLVTISLGCDRENLKKCLVSTRRVVLSLQDKLLSEKRMAAARRQLLGQLAISSEGGETQCLSMGKSLLSFGTVPSAQTTRGWIEAVTAEDIRDAACAIFSEEHTSRLVFM